MRFVLDATAVLVLMVQLPVPVFWLVIHPRVDFWRRRPRAWYYRTGLAVWLFMWIVLLLPFNWWIEERFWWHPLLALVGVGLIATDICLIRRAEHQAGWRVLVGLPELQPRQWEPKVVTGGIYDRLRHPRYLGMMLSWWGAVLLSGATRLLIFVLFFSALAALMVELEERELRARLGQAYADYCRRVPRFIPRWQAPAEKTGD